MKKPFFSIVIPTLNEEIFLPRLLDDLTEQIWTDFEVIHVDGDSDDKTVEKAAKFKKKLNLETIPVKVRNVSVQRNRGGKAASGEWILFFDADNQIESDFLLGLRYKISLYEKRKKPLDVFSTCVSLNDEDKAIKKNSISVKTINAVLYSTGRSKKPRVFGAMLGIRKGWFSRVQFDEKKKVMEDVDFVERAIDLDAEYRIFRSPTYKFSMRRFDDKNLLETAFEAANIQRKLLMGKELTTDDYEMSGGTNYDK